MPPAASLCALYACAGGGSPGSAPTAARGVAQSDLQSIVECLWRYNVYNNVDNVMLRSASVETTPTPTRELTLARLVRGGGSAGCDRIQVSSWRYQADPQSGLLMSGLTDLWSFDARDDATGTQLCAP